LGKHFFRMKKWYRLKVMITGLIMSAPLWLSNVFSLTNCQKMDKERCVTKGKPVLPWI